MKTIYFYNRALLIVLGLGMLFGCREDFNPEIVQYPAIGIESFNPPAARPGATVSIAGSNFGDRTEPVSVNFSGIAGEIVTVTDNEITVLVPEEAVTGELTVKVWLSEKAFEEGFIVIPGAKITSYSSTSVSPGDIVSIIGMNFGTESGDVIITLNGVLAEIVSITDTEIQFRVPETETGTLIVDVGSQIIEGPMFLVGIERVTGGLFGHSGSWGGNSETEIGAGVDGDPDTFVDAPSSTGYLGYNVEGGYGVILTTIRYFPRKTHASRMVGAEIRGTNDPLNAENPLNGDFEVLHLITETPSVDGFTQVDLPPGTMAYKYVYIYFPSGGANLSEIEFYGKIEVPKLTGTMIGHDGSYNNNPETEFSAALDGDVATFVDAATSNGYVGYDFGSGKTAVITKFRYSPRASHPGRMVGGELRGSNDADFLGSYTVLYTIEAEPKVEEYTEVKVDMASGFRYVYYYSPAGYCNVSEVEFYGLFNN